MADYGAKASVPGFDIDIVVDYLQYFNSSWPHLKIEVSGSATITLNATPQTIYTHNLGYPPAYFLIINGKFSAFSGEIYAIGVDEQVLAYDGSSGIGGSYTLYYFICRLPLDKNFTAPTISGSTIPSTTSGNDYGIKVAKPGKNITSKDIRDYSVYSSSRSLMVDTVNIGTANLNGGTGYYERTVNHNVGYVPLGLSYMKWGNNTVGRNPNYYFIMPPVNSGINVEDYSISSTQVFMRADSTFINSPPITTAVVLKDPFAKQLINISLP